MGIPKARVFPVPVLARPIISRPCIAGSRTAFYKNNNNNSEDDDDDDDDEEEELKLKVTKFSKQQSY